MSHIDDLIGIAALATLGWTVSLIAQPALFPGVATNAFSPATAIAAAPHHHDAPGPAPAARAEGQRRS